MSRRHKTPQPDLFATIGHNSPPRPGAESDRIYKAVLLLRIYGLVSVYRAGREHQVGRRQVTTHQLLQLAQAQCRQRFGLSYLPDYALQRLGM